MIGAWREQILSMGYDSAPIALAAVHHPCIHTQCAFRGGHMADLLLLNVSRCSKAF